MWRARYKMSSERNTALYQEQIDAYNLQRQALGYAVGNVEKLNRTLNALNNESRLALQPLESSQRFNLRSTIADRQARGAIDLASGRENTEAIARAQYGDAAYDAEVSTALETVEGISDLDISNLQGQADDAIEVFRDAITAPARTLESINTAFQTLLPSLRTLYDGIREQIIGPDGIISEAEQIRLNDLGTFENFTQQYRDLADTAIEGVKQAEQRLAITSQQIATSTAISEFGELVNAPNATINGLTEAWNQNVLPLVNALYDKLFAEIAGPDGFINTTEETTAFLELGSREDFVADYENNIFMPALDSLKTIEQDIAQLLQSQELDDALSGFNDAILVPGQTIEGLTTYWENQRSANFTRNL